MSDTASITWLHLLRAHYPTHASGVLTDGQGLTLHTLEPPWADNRRGESCVPRGDYDLHCATSDRFGPTAYLKRRGVVALGPTPDHRDSILFHAGNSVDETRGCILVGKQARVSHGRINPGTSRVGMAQLQRWLDKWRHNRLKLRIY